MIPFDIEVSKFDHEHVIRVKMQTYHFDKQNVEFVPADSNNNNLLHEFMSNKIYVLEIKLLFKNINGVNFLNYSLFTYRLQINEIGNLTFSVDDEEEDFFFSDFTQNMMSILYMDQQVKRGWLNLTKNDKKHYLTLSYFYTVSNGLDTVKNKVLIDGQFVSSKQDFLCYFNEEAVGILGYFGRCFDSLQDTLTGGFIKFDYPMHITWVNFSHSKRNFDDQNDLGILLEILTEYTELILED